MKEFKKGNDIFIVRYSPFDDTICLETERQEGNMRYSCCDFRFTKQGAIELANYIIAELQNGEEDQPLAKKMNFNPSKYRGSFAVTSIEPTDKEVLFVLTYADYLIQNNRIKESSYQEGNNDFCDCVKLGRTSEEQAGYVVYHVSLTEEETDVPVDDWQDEYRELSILQCPNCKSWVLTD